MTIDGALRQELAAQLAEKCQRHHLVVWDDPARHYEGVADSVVPEGWRIERYAGSWWDLRRHLEEPFSAAKPPRIVVYLPVAPLPIDPLEEVRRSGGAFKRLLPTLLKEALDGEVGAARLAELGEKCPTLLAAEDALGGYDQLDPRLVAETGANDAEAVVVALLAGDLGDRTGHDQALFNMVADLCRAHLGARPDTATDIGALRAAVARHLVVGELAGCLGDPAVRSLDATWQPLATPQRRNLASLSQRLGHTTTIATWGEMADQATSELRLDELPWDDHLLGCDVARQIDELAFAEAARRLVDDPSGARDIAARRIGHSRWLCWRDDWSGRALADFEAVRAVARLRLAIDAHPVSTASAASLGETLAWYADGAWAVDRAHRLMEGCRFGLARPGLDEAYTAARDSYLTWLDELLTTTNAAAARQAETGMPRQSDIFERHVAGRERVALVIADAMRLELGHRLSQLAEPVTATRHVDVAVAAVPTVTAVGMPNLLPGASDDGLGVDVDVAGNELVVDVGGVPVGSVADRTAAYRKAAGRVEDDTLSEWLSLGDDVLKRRVEAADLVVVRSQEIDAAGERGMLAVRWSQIDAAVETLAVLVSRLAAAGITKVVVTADHGFLALGRPLDVGRRRRPPSGTGITQHGRAWIGHPATVPDGCTTLPLTAFAVRSAESIVVPDAMTAFGESGGVFFHGGISPQELLVPVVVLELSPPAFPSGERATVHVSVPGGRISAEAFSIRVGLGGSLFTSEVSVRITAAHAEGQVARLVPGESVDPHMGTVRLDPNDEAVLTFLVTENLDRGSTVDVRVLDATTGRELASADATVVKDLRPEEEW